MIIAIVFTITEVIINTITNYFAMKWWMCMWINVARGSCVIEWDIGQYITLYDYVWELLSMD